MPSRSHAPPIARCLLAITLSILGFLSLVSASHGYAASLSPQNNPSLEADVDPPAPIHEKRLLGLGNVIGIVPSLLGNLVPGGIASSLASQVTADINSLLPILDGHSSQPPDGVALTTSGQTTLPLNPQPMSTGAQLGAFADKLGGLLNGIVPAAAPSIIAAITKQAYDVVASVDAIATEVASLGNQLGSDQIQAPDALGRIGGLLGSLDSKVNNIINDVTSDLAPDIPAPILQDLGQVISSGLGDIVGATNGLVSLVGDLIKQNVCGVVTPVDGILATVAGLCGDMPSAVAQVSLEISAASLTNPDVPLTDYTSSATSLSSPGITGSLASPLTARSTEPGESGVSQTTTTGVNGIITITEYQALTQQCSSSVAQSLATHFDYLTVVPYIVLPHSFPRNV
ncbi:hypothetical protein F4861DRAFT_540204 [Xylaria intraflava]|nr:hypothetical protein F4861DRAFT_540204 [Xylaria intraflava]